MIKILQYIKAKLAFYGLIDIRRLYNDSSIYIFNYVCSNQLLYLIILLCENNSDYHFRYLVELNHIKRVSDLLSVLINNKGLYYLNSLPFNPFTFTSDLDRCFTEDVSKLIIPKQPHCFSYIYLNDSGFVFIHFYYGKFYCNYKIYSPFDKNII